MKHHNKLFTITCLTAAVLLSSSSILKAQDEAAEEESLYDRLGGVYNIAVVVDDFIERMLVNEVVNSNPAVAASRARISKAGLKFQVTALVCQITGGPEKYTGRSMVDSHAHLNISESEWQAMTGEFKNSLDKYGVPEKEQDELFVIVGSTKADIVKNAE